jgi:hypothetical protein
MKHIKRFDEEIGFRPSYIDDTQNNNRPVPGKLGFSNKVDDYEQQPEKIEPIENIPTLTIEDISNSDNFDISEAIKVLAKEIINLKR